MNTIRLGVVGLGRGFVLTLPALRRDPRIALGAAFDPRPEASDRFAAEFSATGYASLDDLLADSAIDAVYIASPHEWHAAQAIAALAAGKHVLVEKPMAVSVAECAAMVRAAEDAGRFLIVGPSHGFDEPVRSAATLIASGRFGRVRMVTALNFTDFLYRPRRPAELDTSRGGGVVYSQAAHQVDVVRRLVGQPVTGVRAFVGSWDAARGCEGAYQALLDFADGSGASLTYSGYAHYDSDELVGWISELGYPKQPGRHAATREAIAGLDSAGQEAAKLGRTFGPRFAEDPPAPHHEHFGLIIASCERADLKILPTGIDIHGDEGTDWLAVDPPAAPRAAVIDELAKAVLDSAPPVHGGRWGLETVACCAAILESGRSGAAVDPQTIISNALEQTTP